MTTKTHLVARVRIRRAKSFLTLAGEALTAARTHLDADPEIVRSELALAREFVTEAYEDLKLLAEGPSHDRS